MVYARFMWLWESPPAHCPCRVCGSGVVEVGGDNDVDAGAGPVSDDSHRLDARNSCVCMYVRLAPETTNGPQYVMQTVM